jgi:mRNA interferase RelE/StbE
MRLKGENVNVDVKKLTGDWTGYYRLRKGKIRIIFSLNKSEKSLYVEKIDYRGDVYK